MPTQPSSNFVRGLLGCGGLMLGFFALAVVAAVDMPSKDGGAPKGTSAGRRTDPTIVATIEEFQTGIPRLEEQGLDRQPDPSGIEYRWESGASWIKFHGSRSATPIPPGA